MLFYRRIGREGNPGEHLMRRGKGDIRGQKRRARERKRLEEEHQERHHGHLAEFFYLVNRFLRWVFGEGGEHQEPGSQAGGRSCVQARPHRRPVRFFRRRRVTAHGFVPSHHSIQKSHSILDRRIQQFRSHNGGEAPPKHWLVRQAVNVSHVVVRLRGYRGHWVRQKLRKRLLNSHGIPFRMH